MPPRDTPSSALYLLERSDVGVVHLDRDLNVSSMNSYAQCVLSVAEKQPFDRAGGRRGAAGEGLRIGLRPKALLELVSAPLIRRQSTALWGGGVP